MTLLLGVAVFFVLRNSFAFYDLAAAGFGLAATLFMLLLLTGSGPVEEETIRPVRKIVPAQEPMASVAEPVVMPTRVTSVSAQAAREAVAAEVTPASAKAAVETAPAPAPVSATPVTAAAPKPAPAAGPLRLSAPRDGKADDLKTLEGIGPALEKLLNGLGFYHFDQIAGWSDADVAAVDAEMPKFKGRITRDRWVAQARIIVTEGLVAFQERAKSNNY